MSEQHANAFSCDTPHASSQKLYKWLQAGEGPWLKKASKVYKKLQKKTKQTKRDNAKQQSTSNQDFTDTEAERAEEERRIDDDDLYLTNQVKIGLDINKEIENILKPKDENMPQLDDELKSCLKQEADTTLLKLRSENMMRAAEVKSLRGRLSKFKLERRWRLYRFWVDAYRKMQLEQIPHMEKEHSQIMKDYKKEKKITDADILRKSSIIAMTTTGAARYHDILQEIGPKIVIVEEAAEVLEAHIVTALSPHCEHLILIGDHKQLEPKPSVMQLALKYNLSLSMFERMLNNVIANHCLQRQHRMRPEISTLVRDIYPVLEDSENVLDYEHIMGVKKDVFFINHNKPEDYAGDIKSYSNRHEAKFISEMCRYLLKQGYQGNQITVLAAYTGQMFTIRELIPKSEFEGVKIVAIDNFQGEENDIILLSLVRSNQEGKIGFLSRQNRICVALSRAKKGLYVIGNFHMFVECSSQWSHIVMKVKKAEQFGDSLPLFCQNHPHEDGLQVTKAGDFANAPDGGCQRPCGFILPCGHPCRLACHPSDSQHTKYKCTKTCTETCVNGHPCNKPCHLGKLCNCQALMEKPLLCGHVTTLPCYKYLQVPECNAVVRKDLPCGHTAEMKCCADPACYPCEILVTKVLEDCGHTGEIPCSKENIDFKCQKQISIVRECGHHYQIACYIDSKQYQRENLCNELVTKVLPCSHVVEVKCCVSQYGHCMQSCVLTCQYGHTCGKKCHFPTACQCGFLVQKRLPICGHQVLVECHSVEDLSWMQVPCEEIVAKTIPLCGHSKNMKCKEAPETQQCREIVRKTLVCGHDQEQECSAISVTCSVNVLKTLPCGHQQLVPCNKVESAVPCMNRITKKFKKCGHITEIFCWASSLYSQCLQTITLEKCGHQKTITCEEKMRLVNADTKNERLYKMKTTCFTEVTLDFPCGHREKTQCYMSGTMQQCSYGCCRHILSCGHPCDREDDDCSKKLVNEKCLQPCNRLLVCGHQCKSATCGLCTYCTKPCSRYCPHRKCKHECSRQCPPCLEKCPLQCPHHNCSHLCYEECNRPPCKSRCTLSLKCSHPCMGYCGEPCPSLCLVCEPNRRFEISKTCKEDIRLIRLLDCGHEHDAALLDDLFNGDTENCFNILRCPSCEQVIYWHPRYNNLLKRQWHAIDAVKTFLLSCVKGCTSNEPFPMIAGGVSNIRTYLRKLNTFLYLSENLSEDKNLLVKSQEWMKYRLQSLTVFLDKLSTDTLPKVVFAAFNEQLRKLTAIHMLLLMYSNDSESDDSDGSDDDDYSATAVDAVVVASTAAAAAGDDDDDDDDDEPLKTNQTDLNSNSSTVAIAEKLKRKTEVEEMVFTKETFTQNDLLICRELVSPFIAESTEAIQSLDFPVLQSVNIHLEDWTHCSKGHFGPLSIQDYCQECSFGSKWTAEMLHSMEEMRKHIASKQKKGKLGKIQPGGESRHQLGKNVSVEPCAPSQGESTTLRGTPQNDLLAQLDDEMWIDENWRRKKSDPINEEQDGHNPEHVIPSKILRTEYVANQVIEGNGETGDVQSRLSIENRRPGTLDPRFTDRKRKSANSGSSVAEENFGIDKMEQRYAKDSWRTGRFEPRKTEENWRTGKVEPRKTNENWRTEKVESRKTNENWRTEKVESRKTNENWRTEKVESRKTNENWRTGEGAF